jgi:hypothetical protein
MPIAETISGRSATPTTASSTQRAAERARRVDVVARMGATGDRVVV